MKNVLLKSKSAVLFCCLFLMNTYVFAQGGSFCEDFNGFSTTSPVGTLCDAICHPSLVNNWGGRNIQGINYQDTGSIGGVGDYYLYLDDGSCGNGSTFAYNDTDYNGNWIDMVPQEEGCFCFDMRAFHVQTGTITGFNTLHIYDGPDLCSSTFSAVFQLSTPIDVALGWQRVCAPIAFSDGAGNLPSNSDGQWVVNTGIAADWDALVTNVNSISFLVDVASGDERWGIDNICISEVCDPTIGGGDDPTPDGAYCCEGENLVTNGNFEFGDTGFTSAYTQSTVTFPGEYDVTTTAGAFGANVTDHSFCADPTAYATNDMFMVVNGRTQQTTSSVIWEQNITGLEEGQEYKFCANFKDMEQCTFNIFPRISMNTSYGSISQIIDTDDSDPCDWQRIEFCFIADGPDINLQIELDETGNGDGNDLAIDDIALQQKIDPNYFLTIQHQGNNNTITGSLNTIVNTDDVLLSEECENDLDSYYWFAYEPVNPNNPNLPLGANITPGTFGWGNAVNFGGISTSTWNLTTMFPSYPFMDDTFYVIGMWIPSCCESCYEESWEYQITYNFGMAPVSGTEFTDATKAEIKRRFVKMTRQTLGDDETRSQDNTSLQLFPNPASGSFSIALLDDTIESVEVVSITGQVVLSERIQGKSQETFNISSLSSGMYFVNITSGTNRSYSKKLLKE